MYKYTCFKQSVPPNKGEFKNIHFTILHSSQLKVSRSPQTHFLCFDVLLLCLNFLKHLSLYRAESHIAKVEKLAVFELYGCFSSLNNISPM
jgi:hypothetical protein